MKVTIGIFQGKQKLNNRFLLETLYDKGPLTAWELTKINRNKNRMSLHATYNKRLRMLAKKGYVRKGEKSWMLQPKGVIAVLLIQPEPKPWNNKWNEIIDDYLKSLEKNAEALKIATKTVDGFLKSLENNAEISKIITKNVESFSLRNFTSGFLEGLRNFESWVSFANWVKKRMENGFLNFDVIKNKTLLALIIAEASHDFVDTALGE